MKPSELLAMDIDNYEPPNVLFLKGCFLRDCDSVEDLFDQKLLSADIQEPAFYEIKNIEYDKIPNKFVSLESWPTVTNLKCWNCGNTFTSRPIFIPLVIESNGHMDPHGNFCSWGCGGLYINLHYDTDDRWEKHAMLRALYKVFTKKTIHEIIPALCKTSMIQYGGKKTIKEYRDHLLILNDNYETAIKHNSINTLTNTTNIDTEEHLESEIYDTSDNE